MKRTRRSRTERAETLARALDTYDTQLPGAELDADTAGAVAAARALAPAVQPRESYRTVLLESMRREFLHGPQNLHVGDSAADAESEVPVHRLDVVDPLLGRVTLTDIEPISPQRAATVVAGLNRTLSGQHHLDD